MPVYNTICEEKHKHIDEKLEEHSNRLNIHGDQIDDIAKGQVRTETVVEQLCTQISNLVKEISTEREARHAENKHLLWAFIGGMSAVIFAFLGFLFWFIQQLPV